MKIHTLNSRSILKKVLLLIVPLLVAATNSQAVSILNPGDSVIGGYNVGGTYFFKGTVSPPYSGNTWAANESPDHAIDGVGQKYINYQGANSGLILTPSVGSTIVNALRIWTANDVVNRDPSTYAFYGSNVVFSSDQIIWYVSDFTPISSGFLNLPSGRNPGGSTALNDDFSQEVSFTNTQSYTTYMIVFPTVKGAGANMQIGELQFYYNPPVEPPPSASVPDSGSTIALLGAALFGMVAFRRKRA